MQLSAQHQNVKCAWINPAPMLHRLNSHQMPYRTTESETNFLILFPSEYWQCIKSLIKCKTRDSLFHKISRDILCTILCCQVYLYGSLPAYWARCNVILGESASIDAWECRGETPSLNNALEERTGSHNCSYTGFACVRLESLCVCNYVYFDFKRHPGTVYSCRFVCLQISGNADKSMQSRRGASTRQLKHWIWWIVGLRLL